MADLTEKNEITRYMILPIKLAGDEVAITTSRRLEIIKYPLALAITKIQESLKLMKIKSGLQLVLGLVTIYKKQCDEIAKNLSYFANNLIDTTKLKDFSEKLFKNDITTYMLADKEEKRRSPSKKKGERVGGAHKNEGRYTDARLRTLLDNVLSTDLRNKSMDFGPLTQAEAQLRGAPEDIRIKNLLVDEQISRGLSTPNMQSAIQAPISPMDDEYTFIPQFEQELSVNMIEDVDDNYSFLQSSVKANRRLSLIDEASILKMGKAKNTVKRDILVDYDIQASNKFKALYGDDNDKIEFSRAVAYPLMADEEAYKIIDEIEESINKNANEDKKTASIKIPFNSCTMDDVDFTQESIENIKVKLFDNRKVQSLKAVKQSIVKKKTISTLKSFDKGSPFAIPSQSINLFANMIYTRSKKSTKISNKLNLAFINEAINIQGLRGKELNSYFNQWQKLRATGIPTEMLKTYSSRNIINQNTSQVDIRHESNIEDFEYPEEIAQFGREEGQEYNFEPEPAYSDFTRPMDIISKPTPTIRQAQIEKHKTRSKVYLENIKKRLNDEQIVEIKFSETVADLDTSSVVRAFNQLLVLAYTGDVSLSQKNYGTELLITFNI